jgi:purine-nucleoside phosphorylase
LEDRLARAAGVLRRAMGAAPETAVVLGSGFQCLAGAVDTQGELAYERVPGFPRASVAGHENRLIWGTLGPMPVVMCLGRAHYYEGHAMEAVTWPVRVLAAFGVRILILTNAAGGIRREFQRGDFMRASDHINFTGVNPLRGISPPDNRRFTDLSACYSRRLGGWFAKAARRAKVRLRTGVYLGVSGPSYETPAEIRAFRKLGADAVGMSTVPEAVMARYCGLEVAAVSCITNPAAGVSRRPLAHEDVLAAARENSARARRLFEAVAEEWARARGGKRI